MKKIILTFVALLSMTMAMAQNDDCCKQAPKQMTAEMMTTMMTGKLGLSDAQKAKVEALNNKYQDLFQHRMRNFNSPKTGDSKTSTSDRRPQMTDEMKAQMRDKMKEFRAKRQEYESQLKSILSDSQYQTYQQLKPGRGYGRFHGHNNINQPAENQ